MAIWHRKIKETFFLKEDADLKEPKNVRVYIPSCGWGELTDFSPNGNGYVKLDNGGGQIIRNWDHFLDCVITIQTD